MCYFYHNSESYYDFSSWPSGRTKADMDDTNAMLTCHSRDCKGRIQTQETIFGISTIIYNFFLECSCGIQRIYHSCLVGWVTSTNSVCSLSPHKLFMVAVFYSVKDASSL
ncbi:hypothetical protein L1887_19791 [Cichorium endivia]|nr:hypothetical protein L1887_19791 [Cichorium endivia]